MADPWAAFVLAPLVENDAPAITTSRPPVPSTSKVIGDREAEDLGLYETAKPQGDPWAAFISSPQQAPQAAPQTAPFDQRFVEGEQRPDMQSALAERALQMARGPQTSPAQNMDIAQSNVLPAATQGASPNVSEYGGRLVSKEAFQSDSGEILYRDPATGEVRPTDSKTQVALRDPADNTVKIFSRDEATNENPAVGVSRVLAPGIAAGAPTARALITAPSKSQVKASDIFATAKPYYRAFKRDAAQVDVPGVTANVIADNIRTKLTQANLIPELASPVYKAVELLDRGEQITLDTLQNVKRVVGRSFNSPDKNVRDAAAVASKEINAAIARQYAPAAENLAKGDAIHSTARSLQELQRMGAVAGLRKGRAGYGGNAVNSVRQLLSPIVEKSIRGRVTGFKPNELEAMREIVEGTTATNVARGVGQLSPSKGIFQTLGGIGTGVGAGVAAAGPVGIAAAPLLPALGAAANKMAAALTGRQIERLNELVAKRSPAYAEAVAKSIERWERAQAAVASNPTPANFGAYVSASRALSAGLTRDGIEVTSGALIKALPAPMKGAADDENGSEPAGPGVNTN